MIIKEILDTAKVINNNRTLGDVFLTVTEEVGEIATEIAIHKGHKNRKPGPDGIIGEVADAIIALGDIIYLCKDFPEFNGMTEQEIEQKLFEIVQVKLQKWKKVATK